MKELDLIEANKKLLEYEKQLNYNRMQEFEIVEY
jgi:hypothetical protein